MERYRDEPWRCFYGYRLYPTLQTPLFVVQFQYDEFQIHVDGIARGRTWTDIERMQYIRLLSESIRGTLSNVSAVFAPACMSHIVLTKPDWHKVAVKGVTLPEALHCWEQTPIPRNIARYNTQNTVRYPAPDAFAFFQQQYPSLYQTYKNNFNQNNGGFYKVPAGGPYQHSGAPSASKIFSMYPYGMPVVTSDGGVSVVSSNGGSAVGHSGEAIDLDNGGSATGDAEDELSQYYSNGRQMTFNYGTQSGLQLKTKNAPVNGANHYYSANLQEDMMLGDDPRVAMSSSEQKRLSDEASKSMEVGANGDENGNNIVVITSSVAPPTLGHRSTHHGAHSHNNNKQTNRQDKKRRKRKRRKHLQRRTTTTSTTTISPFMMFSSTSTPLPPISYKPNKRQPMSTVSSGQLEDNNIKLHQQYQNDGTSSHHQHHHTHQSRSKKHNRANRMSSPFDFATVPRQQHNFGDQWSSMSGGDDGVTDSFTTNSAGKCHFRLIDGDSFMGKANGFSCPYFRD